MNKKLNVNCAICDLRGITEEKAKAYDEIKINSACIFTSPEARKALLGTKVSMNTAQEIELDEKVNVVIKNGRFTIRKNTAANPNDFLLVNGSLEIEPGAAEAAKGFMKILVNGEVICPESIAEAASSIIVNGETSYYPDDKIMFDGKIDKVFLMRISEGDGYFTRFPVYLLEDMDYSPLEKSTIQAPEAYIFESFLPAAAKIFPRSANIVILPDGVKRLTCEELTADIVKAYGSKLFIESDVKIADRVALESLEYLKISGKAYVKNELLPLPGSVDAASVMPYADKIIKNNANAYVDKALLESVPTGLLVLDCARVVISPDVTAELIMERLKITDCAVVICSDGIKGAVNAVSQGVAAVLTSEGETDEDEEDMNTEKINAAVCTL